MTKIPPEPAEPTRRWSSVKLILCVSLALNLLVAGLFVGGLIRQSPSGDHRGSAGRGDIGATVIMALPRDTRHALREELKQDGEFDKNRDRLSAMPDLLDELRSEDFDAQAFVDVLSEIRQSRDERLAKIEEAVSRGIAAMSTAERSAYADQLEEMLQNQKRCARR
ncbi:periplasmic heavy metal sensor [Paracoccus saliphilus]|uniref:Heavy-metal resistance n=1 Tax=Paracoccus saliphilus TaxID=405559 RepID=A0AA45W8Q4_9RHOB|nr:periplasmic heavy metal sensor [Paracoccus saliphilus]WCR02650.1 periplasmic heavy metal sensor [Paracoccus saliphilus]SIT18491.1 Heavy-metal resistance [Paracoccus saliphilus]